MTNDELNDTLSVPGSDSHDLPEYFGIKTLEGENKSQPIIFENLPKAVRSDLDNLASSVFDPDGGRALIIGFPMSGKSFFIEQFGGNIDRYLEKTDQEELMFVYLDSSDIPTIESLPGGYSTYISNILKQTKLKEEEVCFVTESFEIANSLSVYAKKSKILFELSIFTYNQLMTLEMKGQSKTWMSWPTLDMNFTHCTKDELVNLLHESLSEKLSKAYKIDIQKKDILVFINYCLRQIPELKADYDKGKIIVPPGIWANAIRRVAGSLAFASDSTLHDKKGKKVFGRVTTKVFNEIQSTFDEYLQLNEESDGILDGIPAELLEQMGVRVISVQEAGRNAAGKDAVEPTVDNPRVFSDFDTLSERLQKEVLGQDSAIDAVVKGLIVPAAGLNEVDKPVRSMLLLGPTGVGKTKLATTLANELMGQPLNVVRLDMSEYGQSNEAVKLFGAPPGYLGHDRGGILTSAIEANPHSLILLDEVEKAHPIVWDSFLQVLDAGRMTSGTGVEVDFTKTVIIMTSNLGSKEIAHKAPGFTSMSMSAPVSYDSNAAKSVILKEVERFFKPELINRIDELIIFNQLSQDTAREIVSKEIETVCHRARLAGFTLDSPSADIIEAILQKSDVSKYGAREIKRVVLKHVSSPIAKNILKKERSSTELSLVLDENNEISVMEN